MPANGRVDLVSAVGIPEEKSSHFHLAEQITPSLRAHPDVLELRWQIYAQAKNWEACLDIASAVIKLAAERPFGWIHRSFALHELKRTAEARDHLLEALHQFPKQAIMRYNLACYETQLSNLKLALAHLERAFDLDGSKHLKLPAVDDPDLAPLWKNMGTTLGDYFSGPREDQQPDPPA